MKPSKDITRLIEIMAALRDPVTGCPWDQEQTFETIAPYTIEEGYEVADAIARADLNDLKDELGDLLFQVVYHSRMAEERGAFAFGDVVQASTEKMIRRHPHVFGTEAERAAGVQSGFWEQMKAKEKGAAPKRTLDNVPLGLPALTRAIKLQNKAARVGFDWPSLEPVFAKVHEEIAELEAAMAAASSDGAADQRRDDCKTADPHVEEEFGDLMFVMANVARHLKIDPETALRAANDKFTRRFRFIEDELAKRGSAPADSTLAEMDKLWNAAKAAEKAASAKAD
ncbi:nucleoside triphosphate pyrophosphohydrolase [Hyphomicrobium sulfonivorans]|uniref:nucleoside triphosphate pyrophosphohydrolase n=1 Tax=Hyphomicrobium sulfonivorans TaxID=121290 RepID=UPI001571003D|nr:nucleoside triphosphate pyrophosphohydrolase [Hyphomicrobium sulfonivorans]MBI1650525.1 nucleoside triphosphate pyrophosphohydrolase [Hyphomicrobium sulfonivorans]NSL72117.1 nucleoside triphosphate pyrophosphohydrolase [Hyphomicrobium sulfonivorans]